MAETGTSISHCPTSQQFLGSGTMPWKRTVASGVNISIGTDFGGGDEWLIPQVLGDCVQGAHLRGRAMPVCRCIRPNCCSSGTVGGARALDMEDRIGNFDAGREADFMVVDPARSGHRWRRR